MSLDFLRVGLSQTTLSAPDTSLNSAITSKSAEVFLDVGLGVSRSGVIRSRLAPGLVSVGPGASAATIPTDESSKVRVSAAGGAATGAILAAGTKDGQEITLINTGSPTITFAAVGTSNVAGGTSDAVPALACLSLVWSAADSKWYKL